nr:dirigent protein 22-like [Ziziphus jujuba var. spinosa]
MANTFSPFILFSLYFTIFSIFLSKTIDGFHTKRFVQETKATDNTKTLHFYFHDILSGKNPTAVNILKPSGGSISSFGSTMMIDDALTDEQDSNSNIIGRAQGFYSVASQSELAFLMVMTFSFTEGEYSGSTLSIVGRNPVMNDVREMPVVGGTGKFRFARGYALAHTVWFDASTGDATVEYNVHLLQDGVSSVSVSSQGYTNTYSFLFSLFLLIISNSCTSFIEPFSY